MRFFSQRVAAQKTTSTAWACFGPLLWSKRIRPKTGNVNGDDESYETRDSTLQPQLLASLPAFEQILALLLVHPGYMLRLYKVYVERKINDDIKMLPVAWTDLYLGLVRDLYRLTDPHSERLFIRLHRRICAREMLVFKREENGAFHAFIAGQWDRFLSRALNGYLEIPLVRRWLRKVLNEHISRIVALNTDLDPDPAKVDAFLNGVVKLKGADMRDARRHELRKEKYKLPQVRREVEARVAKVLFYFAVLLRFKRMALANKP